MKAIADLNLFMRNTEYGISGDSMRIFIKKILKCAECPNCNSYAADRFFCRVHTLHYSDIKNDLDYHLIPDIHGQIPDWCHLEIIDAI